jgi:hypothetical protein
VTSSIFTGLAGNQQVCVHVLLSPTMQIRRHTEAAHTEPAMQSVLLVHDSPASLLPM